MCVMRYQMKALAILRRLIPAIRGLEKKYFLRLHCYNMSMDAVWDESYFFEASRVLATQTYLSISHENVCSF